MRDNILYDCYAALPNIRGHLHRARIDKLLYGLLDHRLITVTAGAGWGKTHAVSAFLNNAPVRVVWFQLSDLDNHLSRFWEEFVHLMAFQNKETAAQLELLGFPENLAKFDQFLHILAKEIYAGEQVVFVFDDFHLIYDESVIFFVKGLISAKLENSCVIINSRTNLSSSLAGTLGNDLEGRVTAEDLHFTPQETEDYLKQNGITLPARETKKVQTITEGWPLGLYLVGLSIKKGGMVSNDPLAGAMPLIFEMIEREMFVEYAPRLQNFLIRASLLKSFPEGLVAVLAGEHLISVLELLNNSMFIYYNPHTGYYNFHHLFLEFLSGKQKYLEQSEITETYLKAADWCAANNLKLEAFAYYDKCGHYDEILHIMLNFGVAIFSKTLANFYIELIDKFPPELVKNNPILHVHRAGLLHNNAQTLPAIDELLRTRDELEAQPRTEENKKVLGEVYCMLGLLNIAMSSYDFMEQLKKASEYLPNGGMIDSSGKIINTRYAIMINSPAPGELEKMENAMFYAMPYASKAMNGYGHGVEYLASAEAAYLTGNMKKAAKNAFEAVYRARGMQVNDVACSGYFLLMRVEAANGNYESVVSHLEQLRAYMEGIENKWNFIGMPDVAEGWFNVLFGGAERVASWIVDDTIGGNVLAPYSIGMERMVKARSLLKDGRYYELLAWLGQSEELIRQCNMWLVLLDTLIYKAIASHHIQDEAQTAAALQGAYEIAHGNNIVMPFAELGNDIRAVIYSVKRDKANTIPTEWLDEISAKATTYEKHLRGMRAQHQNTSDAAPRPSVKCTKREKELLGYLCQGLTNQEIANACFITLSAVKKTMNNIYIKLGATNRADAVRIALQAELN